MKTLIGIFFLGAFTFNAFGADCGMKDVEIIGGEEIDVELACEGIVQAKELNKQHFGIVAKTKIVVKFEPNLVFKWYDESLKETSQHPVYGFFDRNTKMVSMSPFNSEIVQNPDRSHFKIKIKRMNISDEEKLVLLKEMHRSVIVHEVTHLITNGNFEYANPSGGLAEYLSYYIQIEALTPDLRKTVLDAIPGTFAFLSHINMMIHHYDPHAFGVAAFRHFSNLTTGEKLKFLKDVFSGALNPDDAFNMPI